MRHPSDAGGAPIVAIASGEVGLACLTWLLDRGYPVREVFLGHSGDSKIGALCQSFGVAHSVFSSAAISEIAPTGWLLSLWNPHILQKETLDKADFRLNLHPALVPYCRGNDTAAWALQLGEPSGVSLLEMDEGIDTGGIWAQRSIVTTEFMRGGSLLESMKQELVVLFREEWPGIYAGSKSALEQGSRMPGHTRRQTNEDRVRSIDQFVSVPEFITWARAHDFAPTSMAELLVHGIRYEVTLQITEIPNENEPDHAAAE